ncbi:TraR/DksA family transcriptional regulator [Ciceribacter sp. L1K23]|uniref:TraR/DksA family transcriptional regulator n=1 Tax=unclassified Ciceribacter TaxID=2628820 RepID=UPI001ABDC183|nr:MULTISPECIES: TraR/DksA C4-type zinc finger protein [unclassified Ciceribacter]MBO3759338.1 TraR/DksA family transcriptional regulator [Ciceribacter sp. L1K22]MBR0556463.1 TraR/DksA family transcriptional regulator [Ciceribacter sp. L1K23]
MDTQRYEEILRRRQSELHARLHRIDDDLGSRKSDDSEERATERENDEVLEELGQVGENELKAIDAALDRIAAGTFGTCAKCGEPIGEARLHAVPYTPFCQACASAH